MTTPSASVPLWVGTYPSAGTAAGSGEAVWRVDLDRSDGSLGAPRVAAEVPSPSFLARHPSAPVVYAVTETPHGRLTALRDVGDGTLEVLSSVGSGGDDPCHVAAADRTAWVANYGDAVAAAVGLAEDGTPVADHRSLHAGSGTGPVTDRQDGPHAHQVTVLDGEVLVTDLGADVVRRYPLDPAPGDGGVLADDGGSVAAWLPAGTGPRHLVVLPGGALVVAGELDARLHVLLPADGAWHHAGSVPVSPRAIAGDAFPGHVTLSADGRRLHVGVRGPDLLAVHSVSGDRTPEIAHLADVPLGEGSWPRHHEVFAATDGAELAVVALQGTSELATVRLDPATGAGAVVDRVAWATPPSCVLEAR
ncbi:beta-propeller fold lactonase family protein [Isoptericola sp. 178]|uniref:lactonase family protein n=1 Tax=Isoptericola sp. 178 TaxID=3064651 RepID=UPI00271421B2|nr:beta-propeller fold lactonase family protein [Isoptericola sp. 178]MDO8143875.1 beta-propeller fold lactonase family protein [Isoptericola sp. 178]